ncbi:MAG: ribosome silencing factor [Acidobacteriota bacterium]|nr:ribosome silencing factor [Acidobacteriota bacterium]
MAKTPVRKTPVRKAAAAATKAPVRRKAAAKPRAKAAPRMPKAITAGIAAAHDKKADNVVIMDLRKASSFTDFFVLCTGQNMRQVKAIAEAIEAELKKDGLRPSLVEGYNKAEWVLLDYFDFIFHVFTPSTREFYGLERLWGSAEKFPVTE